MIDSYLALLQYLAEHPIQSFFIALVQFAVLMTISNKINNRALYTLFALWFVPQDVIVNMVLFRILGLEAPREWTVTSRLKRWKRLSPYSRLDKWRYRIGHGLCKTLNRFDPGHC